MRFPVDEREGNGSCFRFVKSHLDQGLLQRFAFFPAVSAHRISRCCRLESDGALACLLVIRRTIGPCYRLSHISEGEDRSRVSSVSPRCGHAGAVAAMDAMLIGRSYSAVTTLDRTVPMIEDWLTLAGLYTRGCVGTRQ